MKLEQPLENISATGKGNCKKAAWKQKTKIKVREIPRVQDKGKKLRERNITAAGKYNCYTGKGNCEKTAWNHKKK